MQKFILLGASRGLGWHTYQELSKKNKDYSFLLSSRNINKRQNELAQNTQIVSQDFSKNLQLDFVQHLKNFNPTHIIYFAGGGPYGLFESKKWSDHQWALQTSFLYPAELLHHILKNKENWPNLKQIMLIGSAIAESSPDAQASSYSAAKHALKGLVGSIQTEAQRTIGIQLFSPGYMQTDLLPANTKPRLNDQAENPAVVAERLIDYIEKASR